jgi:hypothetical protein
MIVALDTLAAGCAIASIAISALIWLRFDQRRWALLLGLPSLAGLAVPFAYFVMIVGSTLLTIATASASPMGWWASAPGQILQVILRGIQWLPLAVLPASIAIAIHLSRRAPQSQTNLPLPQ